MYNLNNGYFGNRMSNRAIEAYDNGEMPISKWSKSAILDGINECIADNDIEIKFDIESLKKLTKQELVDNFLECVSWHHTGSYFNETSFYSVDCNLVEEMTQEEIKELIDSRIKKVKKITPKNVNKYIAAVVRYNNWTGTRKHPKCESVEEIVFYRSNDKMVLTCNGMKRLSSLYIIRYKEQLTKYPKKERV